MCYFSEMFPIGLGCPNHSVTVGLRHLDIIISSGTRACICDFIFRVADADLCISSSFLHFLSF